MKEQAARLLSGELTPDTTVTEVSSAAALCDAVLGDPEAVGVIDEPGIEPLSELDAARRPPRLIVLAGGLLAAAVGQFVDAPWIAHVMASSLLQHPFAAEHLAHVTAAVCRPAKLRLLDWLGPEVGGRRIRLSRSVRRRERLDRMSGFLETKGVGARTIEQLRDVAEELLTNAFYDAPAAAGALDRPVSRTVDVVLPDRLACDLAYGCRDDLAIVRVKDPFGSLTLDRLVQVLARCARAGMGVEVDESMGGAGLGMWRVFSNATFVAISVVEHSHTEILVGIAKRAPGVRPFAFHLFFQKGGRPRTWRPAADTAGAPPQHAINLEPRPK